MTILVGATISCTPLHPFKYVEKEQRRQAKELQLTLEEPTEVEISGSIIDTDGNGVIGVRIIAYSLEELETCTYMTCTYPFLLCMKGPTFTIPVENHCKNFDSNTDTHVDLTDVWLYMAINQ